MSNKTDYGEVLNEIKSGAELNSGAYEIYKRSYHDERGLHDKTEDQGTKHHKQNKTHKGESTVPKKFCFEGKTYDDTGVSAWVRRSKIPFISMIADISAPSKWNGC
jgi:hypothetical protein